MRVLLFVLVLALATFGCKSKQAARRGLSVVYAPREAIVQVRGDVRNRIIPWNENLTLAGALVEADYIGRWDPLSVTVTRGRKTQRVSAGRLLSGHDMFLEPGDVIDIHR